MPLMSHGFYISLILVLTGFGIFDRRQLDTADKTFANELKVESIYEEAFDTQIEKHKECLTRLTDFEHRKNEASSHIKKQ